MLLAACGGEQKVSGVLTKVESTEISRVDAVTLRTDDGVERRFEVAPTAAQMDHPPSPGHLRQHMAFGDRVTITYRDQIASKIEDG